MRQRTARLGAGAISASVTSSGMGGMVRRDPAAVAVLKTAWNSCYCRSAPTADRASRTGALPYKRLHHLIRSPVRLLAHMGFSEGIAIRRVGLSSWRWLLILEGIPAVVCGIVTLLLLPNRPAEAGFLTAQEKRWIAEELSREEREKNSEQFLSALRTLVHPRVLHLAAALIGFDVALYAMSFYMPQALRSHSTGYFNTMMGILVMVPHLVGLAAMVLVSRSSDHRMERRYHSAIPIVIAGTALLLLGATNALGPSLLLWSFVAAGIYSFFGPFFSIPSKFLAGFSAASGIALINSVGSLGGFVGPSIIGLAASGARGISGALAVAGVALFVSAALVLLLPSRATWARTEKERI